MYQSCCAIVSDGEGSIILLNHLNVMLLMVVSDQKCEKVYMQLIVVVAYY
jgi:hypothetical protein